MKTENPKRSCPLRDSAEHKEQAEAFSNSRLDGGRTEQDDYLMEEVVSDYNMDAAFRKVVGNHGAPGIDKMTIQDGKKWYKTNREELEGALLREDYRPLPVRRKGIPKPDGGTRYLGIPTVIDRTVQQAVAQVLMPIYEGLFAEASYGYRPERNGQMAITRIVKYAEQGYVYAVVLDLSKYFDTINHEKLLTILRRTIKDERVIRLIKMFLRAGVMENGVVMPTKEGSPQGGNISPLLANIYLNEFDQEFTNRGVIVTRYADDIVLQARSLRAAERLLRTSGEYLEGVLKLRLNHDKSCIVKIGSPKFKYLGYTIANTGHSFVVRVHKKTWRRLYDKLRETTSRGGSIEGKIDKLRLQLRGWLNYYWIAQMASPLKKLEDWLETRIRDLIWRDWKRPRTRLRKLRGLGIKEEYAWATAMCRRGPWYIASKKKGTMRRAISHKYLVDELHFYSITEEYHRKREIHVGSAVYRTVCAVLLSRIRDNTTLCRLLSYPDFCLQARDLSIESRDKIYFRPHSLFSISSSSLIAKGRSAGVSRGPRPDWPYRLLSASTAHLH